MTRSLSFDAAFEVRDRAMEVGEDIPHVDDRCLAPAVPLEDRLARLRAIGVDDGGGGPPAEPAALDDETMTTLLGRDASWSIALVDHAQRQPQRVGDAQPRRKRDGSAPPQLDPAHGGLGNLRRGSHIALAPPLSDPGAPHEQTQVGGDIVLHSGSLPEEAYPSVITPPAGADWAPVVPHPRGACGGVPRARTRKTTR